MKTGQMMFTWNATPDFRIINASLNPIGDKLNPSKPSINARNSKKIWFTYKFLVLLTELIGGEGIEIFGPIGSSSPLSSEYGA